jgi:hypothetical protein
VSEVPGVHRIEAVEEREMVVAPAGTKEADDVRSAGGLGKYRVYLEDDSDSTASSQIQVCLFVWNLSRRSGAPRLLAVDGLSRSMLVFASTDAS